MRESERALIRVSAALAVGGRDRLAAALDAAAEAASAAEVEEALVQSYLFLGYPAALKGLALWRERAPSPAPVADDWDVFRRRGEAVCERVYGGQYTRLRENVARLHPDLERWMILEGYGKVLGRAGLELRARELCIVALLSGLDARPQLHSHLRGALNAGASAVEVEEALRIAADELPAERSASAAAIWREVRRRAEAAGAEQGEV